MFSRSPSVTPRNCRNRVSSFPSEPVSSRAEIPTLMCMAGCRTMMDDLPGSGAVATAGFRGLRRLGDLGQPIGTRNLGYVPSEVPDAAHGFLPSGNFTTLGLQLGIHGSRWIRRNVEFFLSRFDYSDRVLDVLETMPLDVVSFTHVIALYSAFMGRYVKPIRGKQPSRPSTNVFSLDVKLKITFQPCSDKRMVQN